MSETSGAALTLGERSATDCSEVPVGHVEVARNDPAEADRLVGAYAPAVYRLALSIVSDHQLAEDVVQEVMFKAWTKLHTLRDPSFERAWVLRIAHNVAVSLGRRRREAPVDPADFPERPTELSPERSVIARADLAAVAEALDAMDDRTRSIVVLRELEGLALDEISVITGLAPPAVRTRLFRARRQLQQSVEVTR
jgi:RNA polymerase sigma-70 factor, ECF subfamily